MFETGSQRCNMHDEPGTQLVDLVLQRADLSPRTENGQVPRVTDTHRLLQSSPAVKDVRVVTGHERLGERPMTALPDHLDAGFISLGSSDIKTADPGRSA
jgi:hypothetical protein